MTIFWRLLRYARPYWSRLGLALGLSVLQVVIELARPWPMKVVVDYVLSGHPVPPALSWLTSELPAATSAHGLLVWSIVAEMVIVMFGALLSFAAMSLTIAVSQRMVHDFSLDVFAKLQRLSLAYHGRYPLGDLLQRVSYDVFVAYFAISPVLLPAIVSLLSLIGMFAIMAQLDLLLACLALIVVPLLALALMLFTKPMDATTERQYAAQGALTALIEQSLANIKVIQGFAREPYVQRKVAAVARDVDSTYNRAIRVSTAYQQLTTAITGVGGVLLLGVGSLRVLSGRLSLGDLLVFLGYLAALYGPVNALSSSVGYAVQVISRGRRVFELMDAEEEVREQPQAADLGRARGEVAFERVSFGYGRSQNGVLPPGILHEISFRALPGQVTAIVGATGVGKSSLISLLARLYDPWQGRVLIDGQDVRRFTLQSLRENIALVLQEPFLFPMSIADNIAFGRPEATRAEVMEAARVARADEFIEKLADGYDTLIEEKGTSLSGGQRQRIAIARAILKDAPILVLDEPTSTLDARTEAAIFAALSHLIEGKTTFIISHRLTTIRRADQIIALENGRIAEFGTHEELMAKGAVYASLYRHQDIAAV